MTKNANFSPRPATKGCCTIAAEDKSLRLCFSVSLILSFFLLAPLATLSYLLWVFLHSRDRIELPSDLSSRALAFSPSSALIYTTSGRIYWPQNTMRTCPCPSTETESRPLVVYLFAVAIHIRLLRHVAARKKRKKGGRNRREEKRDRTLEVFCAWPSRFYASATRAKEVAKQMAVDDRLENAS